MNKQSQFVFLPTDNVSNVYSSKVNEDTSVKISLSHEPSTDYTINYFPCILSDEEIKEGDWHLHFYNGEPVISKSSKEGARAIKDEPGYKKIIATTNPELIKDGVAQIDSIIKRENNLTDLEYIILLYNHKGKNVDKKSWKYVEGVGRVYSNKQEVDVEKLAMESYYKNGKVYKPKVGNEFAYIQGFIDGQSIQDNADKKFTLKDMENIMHWTARMVKGKYHSGLNEYDILKEIDDKIQSITKEQPKNDTVIVEYKYAGYQDDNAILKPKLDKNGNICILRK